MLKTVLAGAAALAIAGSTYVYAQQPASPGATPQEHARDGGRNRPSADDLAAYTDARIAGLKAGLKLTADQEKNWPVVETAIRDLAKSRADRMKERFDRMRERRGAQAPVDFIERLRGRADQMTQRAADLKRFADASEPLYKSLDDGQKHRLATLSRMAVRHAGGAHGRPGRGSDRR